MYLKQLTLKGFKSFADKTTLTFEPGVNVVVGPNGSGKSNLVDAVAWVLGAQGARALRGAKMDDVIFAGTPNRAALGRAEVDLVIDNTSGLLPVEFTEVRITRTLFRSGESDYQLNGTSVRLADIQELLSDSGVGRTQHVIVGQGQLDAILNSRPEDRRAVIEEAAGILKYRRRKERAERRLDATEANLVRLGDLQREVRRQLRPLERQAEAARVHDGLASELRAIRFHLAGQELAALSAHLLDAAARVVELTEHDRRVRRELRDLDGDVTRQEQALTVAHQSDIADLAGRVDALAERRSGIAALVAEKRRGIQRALAAAADETAAAALTADAAALRSQLATVDEEAAKLAASAEEVDAAEARVAEMEAHLPPEPPEPTPDATTAAALRAELATRRAALERARAERSRLDERVVAQRGRRDVVDAEIEARRNEAAAAQLAEADLVTAAEGAANRRAEADELVRAAEDARRSAAAAEQHWGARAEALALALDEARVRTGAERLARLAGVVGPLVELVEIAPGYERAVTAGLGEAVRAVVVDGVEPARRAVEQVRHDGGHALLLVLDQAPEPDSAGSVAGSPGPVPAGARAVADVVRARTPGLGAVLQRLLAGVVAVADDGPDPIDVALARPDLTVVTMAGDWFRAGAPWRAGAAGDSAVTRAAHDEAESERTRAAAALDAARRLLGQAQSRLTTAEHVERTRAAALEANDDRLSQALAVVERLAAEQRSLAAQEAATAGQRSELDERLEPDDARVTELLAQVPLVEAAEAAASQRRARYREARTELDRQLAATAGLRRDLEVREAGVEERRTMLGTRLAEVEERLIALGELRSSSERRQVELRATVARCDRLAEVLDDIGERLALTHAAIHERRRRHQAVVREQTVRLDELRRRRSAAERTLEELGERRRRTELDETETRMRRQALEESAHREFEAGPEELLAAPRPDGDDLAGRAETLEAELRRLGPVNPLALEEHAEIKERAEFLETQIEDVRRSRRELARVIAAVDQEIASMFAGAFADVSRHFEELFVTLFPGGGGRLQLTDPDDLLNTGVEVEARPSGKNVRRLSLLSGGERSLTALAYLFAVYRARPSPFYLLDEVDAALDDVNLHRFVELVNAFRQDAQLMIVSHQKRTMEAGDHLHGVSMAPGGTTRIVSQRMQAAS